ncbi:MAG: lytic murein transglycosylase [Pseudomonadota bacterium]
MRIALFSKLMLLAALGPISAIAGVQSTVGQTGSQAGADQPPAADPTFAQWREGFRQTALDAGISAATIDAALAGIAPVPRVFALQDNQPEFAKGPWAYIDSALSDQRVSNGRLKYQENRIALEVIGNAYDVAPSVMTAIWGLETSYGAVMGNFDTVEVLANFAWKGRRTAFGRSQLLGALKIIDNGYAPRSKLRGSWAGAMGHTQFIPTTYLAYAVDHDQDGQRDIWSTLPDVFASTANYLAASGFNKANPVGVEVVLPAGFDYALTGTTRRALVEWAATGIVAANAAPLVGRYDPNLRGRIIVPAGARGPAFLVFENFEAILKYNRSTSYALAVMLLSQKIAGDGGDVIQPWPRDDRPLSLAERKQLQRALADRGFDPGPVDGIIGAGTKRALRRWQISAGLPADGYASARLLSLLLAQ